MADALSDSQIQDALQDLPGWQSADDALTKSFEFSDFPEAMSFMVRVGFAAESQGHHPKFTNVYNNVTVALSTHDAGGKVTGKDVDLAQRVEAINWIPKK